MVGVGFIVAVVTDHHQIALHVILIVLVNVVKLYRLAAIPTHATCVTDRPKGATDDRRNGATLGWLKRDSNGVSGCGVFGVLCNR